jgi:hypothetical protein
MMKLPLIKNQDNLSVLKNELDMKYTLTKVLSTNNSRTSLFSTKVTHSRGHKSNAVRNRFTENVNMFDPDLKTDNFGMHSPSKIYDT